MCYIDWSFWVNLVIASAAVAAFGLSFWTYKSNRKFIRKQQFESTFFNMMKQLEDIVSKLSLQNKKGRDVFEFFYKYETVYISESNIYIEIIDKFNLIADPENSEIEEIAINTIGKGLELKSTSGIKTIIYYLGIKGYENVDNLHILDHYFRYLYRIVKFVEESDFLEKDKNYRDERYKYIGILRGSLSPYELVFLFYNGLSYGKFKKLIEKYSLLKNIRDDLLANSRVDYELNITEDRYYNDFERYIENGELQEGTEYYLRYKASAISKEDNPHLKNK